MVDLDFFFFLIIAVNLCALLSGLGLELAEVGHENRVGYQNGVCSAT